jgi:hypothetical protein
MKQGLSDVLKELPDFCWMTLFEVLIYAEQLVDFEEDSLGTSLAFLVEQGYLETKIGRQSLERRGPRNILMYKRISI